MPTLSSADLDGDGRDELLFHERGRLRLSGATSRNSGRGRLTETIREVMPASAGHSATVHPQPFPRPRRRDRTAHLVGRPGPLDSQRRTTTRAGLTCSPVSTVRRSAAWPCRSPPTGPTEPPRVCRPRPHRYATIRGRRGHSPGLARLSPSQPARASGNGRDADQCMYSRGDSLVGYSKTILRSVRLLLSHHGRRRHCSDRLFGPQARPFSIDPEAPCLLGGACCSVLYYCRWPVYRSWLTGPRSFYPWSACGG